MDFCDYRLLGVSVLGVSTLIQLYQRSWLIQDDTRLIQMCINRLKTFLCDTNLNHRVKNDKTLYQRVIDDKKVYQRVLDDTKVQQWVKYDTKVCQRVLNDTKV